MSILNMRHLHEIFCEMVVKPVYLCLTIHKTLVESAIVMSFKK